MPEHDAVFMPRKQLLSFEEIHRIVTLLVRESGFRDVRLTGGEPLVRKELPVLVRMLANIDGLDDLSLTTNGILLPEFAVQLRKAGLHRINISLDTLSESVFQNVSRRSGLDKVLTGIEAAINVGFDSVKLNTIAIRGVTESEVVRLVEFASERNVPIRFIEFMPLDTDRAWQHKDVFTGDDILRLLTDHFGEPSAVRRPHPSQPAEDFVFASGIQVGIIRSVTAPFCSACNRIRLTADGAVRNCLFAQDEVQIRDLIRNGATDKQILEQFELCVQQKKAGHGIDEDSFTPPERPMYSIGG